MDVKGRAVRVEGRFSDLKGRCAIAARRRLAGRP
jgi:hypothetical protein